MLHSHPFVPFLKFPVLPPKFPLSIPEIPSKTSLLPLFMPKSPSFPYRYPSLASKCIKMGQKTHFPTYIKA